MRHLIFILIVINLVFFAWNKVPGMFDGAAVHALPPLPPDTRRLITLREVQEQDKAVEVIAQGGDEQLGELEVTGGHDDAREDGDGASNVRTMTGLQPPAAGLPLTCYALGPFLDKSEMQQTAARLNTFGLETTPRSGEVKRKIGYWIYIPTTTRDEARKVTRLLDEKKDKEYFIGKDNVLSLGAFKERWRADKRLKRVRQHGLEPILEPRYKERPAYWLDLQAEIPEAERKRLVLEMPDMPVEQLACESIASGAGLH